MRKTILSTLVVLFTCVACSSSSDDAHDPTKDPTSSESLNVASPIQQCCKYSQATYSSIGSPTYTNNNCANGSCDNVPLSEGSGTMYVGGTVLAGGSNNYNMQQYAGTCSAPVPVNCDEYKNDGDACDECLATKWCEALYFVMHDPNAQAILNCIDGCKDDQACTDRCRKNGEPTAERYIKKLTAYMTTAGTAYCASACSSRGDQVLASASR